MKRIQLLTSLLLSVTALVIPACQTSSPADSETHPAGVTVLSAGELKTAMHGTVDFSQHVKPILEARCTMCHNNEGLPGRMNLTNRSVAIRTGTLGTFIIPGNPEQSSFVSRIGTAPSHLKSMPPVGERITSDEVAVLNRWIFQGAQWPEGVAGTLR